MRVIIVTQSKFNNLNKRVKKYCEDAYGSKMDQWCEEIIHPKDGRIAFTVTDQILGCLVGEKIVELTEDWFEKVEL